MSIKTTTYGFIPTQVSGCVLWLDGADPAGTGVIPANGASITTWTDKSGLGNNATGGVSPTFNTSGINSKGTVSFNGTNSYLNSADLFSNRSFSIFIIIRRQASISSQTGILAGTQFNTNMNLHFVFRSSTNLALGFYANDLDYVSFTNYTGNPATEPAYLIQATYISGTRILYVNGNQVASDTNTTNLSSQVGALIGQYNGTYYNGFIGEICILNGAPNSTSRQQVEAYLAQKWGIRSSLPVGHPGLTSSVYQSSYLKTAGVKTNIATMTPFYMGFSPRQIPGLILWVDGTDPAGNGLIPANDATVSTWVDKSGLANNATTYSGITTYSTSLKALFFSNSGFQTSIVTPTNRVGSGFFVVRATVNSGNVVFQGSGLGYGGRQFRNDNGTILKTIKENIVEMFLAGPTVLNRLMLVGYVDDGNNLTHCLNGTLYTTTTATTFTEGRTILLGKSFNGEHLIGYIHEVVLFNINVTVTQRQQIESYLAQKWGLTSSLAAGHLNATQPAGARTTLSLANSKMSIISRRITAFTSFRWTITVGNTDPYIQMSEFQVGFNNTQVVFISPSISTSGTQYEWYYTTPASHAVDNNISSKAFALGVPALFTVTVASPITVNMYRWATANDSTPGRNPTQWTVDGSADGVTFVRLHTQNTTYAGPNTTFTYTSWINFTY